ncbi:MAG TPA: hypothetical protein EYQ83_00060 [Acidobacteria bacterium]|nr:hypothetical protein [Acidobacteriota bacterium]
MDLRPRTLVATLVIALAAAGAVSAHMAYSKSMPAKDAKLIASPDHVQVWFTQDPEPAVSQISLEGPNGEVSLGETTTPLIECRALAAVRVVPPCVVRRGRRPACVRKSK